MASHVSPSGGSDQTPVELPDMTFLPILRRMLHLGIGPPGLKCWLRRQGIRIVRRQLTYQEELLARALADCLAQMWRGSSESPIIEHRFRLPPQPDSDRTSEAMVTTILCGSTKFPSNSCPPQRR